jgi:hypothetical protein
MFQELLALIIIFLFLARLVWQRYKKQIPRSQFIFWLVFWLIGAVLIIYIKEIDVFVARLGFSSSGIQILFYVAVAIIFYFIFRMRLKIEKMESDLTTVTRLVALRSPHINNNLSHDTTQKTQNPEIDSNL